MKTFVHVLMLFVVANAGVSGCATLFSESEDAVTIDTEPSGAEITFNGIVLGQSPVKVKLRRQMEAPYITIRKSGYVTRTGLLDRSIAPAAFINFAFFPTSGATSWGIDALTGRMFKYYDDAYVYVLEKKGEAAQPTPHPLGFFIARFRSVQKEIARGSQGEAFAGLCAAEQLDAMVCQSLWNEWQRNPARPLAAAHGLQLFRELSRTPFADGNGPLLR